MRNGYIELHLPLPDEDYDYTLIPKMDEYRDWIAQNCKGEVSELITCTTDPDPIDQIATRLWAGQQGWLTGYRHNNLRECDVDIKSFVGYMHHGGADIEHIFIVYQFKDADEAMLFKLTFGGV